MKPTLIMGQDWKQHVCRCCTCEKELADKHDVRLGTLYPEVRLGVRVYVSPFAYRMMCNMCAGNLHNAKPLMMVVFGEAPDPTFKQIRSATLAVARMPAHLRSILAQSGKPTLDTPRPYVDNFKDEGY